ncbi:MAG: primosomal protein N' [Sphaerochaetaceae bacterium]|nr:primosomal protein N' [Sphaerochaetaceae bacterium]
MFAKVLFDLPLDTEFTYKIPEELISKVCVGVRVNVPFRSYSKIGYVIEIENEYDSKYKIKEIKKVVDKEPLFDENQIELAKWMANFYLCSVGEALALQIPGGKREKAISMSINEEDISTRKIDKLSIEQENALEILRKKESALYYLYGVTGSGKSEIYFRFAKEIIKENKQVIYLVPEITLTHQLIQQVSKRFDNEVAILHSAMTKSQRLSQWLKIFKNEVSIVIGVRSAIFAPFHNLGLVIMDEEHENSYKSSQTPRYHARQIAQHICKKNNSILIMGSATPSLEAYRLMKENKIKKIELLNRVGFGIMPKMKIVNMINEKGIISRDLEREIDITIKNKKQVILFLNRRGFSYYFHCRSCGYEMQCPNCSISLTYHKHTNSMVCHYCGYKTKPISICPECNSLDVGYRGFGTEMVEQEIKSLFPFAKVDRLDGDVAKDKKQIFEVLDKFKNGETNILLGTQMVAKGFNFPNVELVGIVLADSAMNIPDFRSQEKTYALITQVAGRAGRFNDKGKVVIQTLQPDNIAIQKALNSERETFYDTELLVRKETDFPPFSRQLNLVFRGLDKTITSEFSEAFEEKLSYLNSLLEEKTNDSVIIYGPNECSVFKIANNYRYNILLQHDKITYCQWLVRETLKTIKIPKGIYIEIDVDPLQII